MADARAFNRTAKGNQKENPSRYYLKLSTTAQKICTAFNRYFVHVKAPILLEFSALLWYNKGNEK